jgi:hypothetical protein
MNGAAWFYSQPGFRLPAKPDYRCAVCGDSVERTQLVCRGDRDAEGPEIDRRVDREIARRKALGMYP